MSKKKGSKLLGLDDERFAHLRSDPKFSGLSNKEKMVNLIQSLVTIGKRFAAVITDPRFSSKARVDKYGRPVERTSDVLDLYELEESDGDDDVGKESPEENDKKSEVKRTKNDTKQDSVSDENEEEEEDVPLKLDLARGEGNVDSSSSDDDSDSESEWNTNENLDMEIDLAHLDEDAEQVEWATSRIAACNMDWNVVHCEDLMMLGKSFIPPGGSIKRITIYLSDFGKERLAEEDKHGPRLQLSKPLEEYEGDKIDEETRLAMRKYQVDQLRYYYAIIECDCMETAVSIYDQCDGYQFEASDIKMDLRFVPDGMEFDKDRIKETLTEEDLNVAKYKSKEKLKSAVAQTSARIGWDETEELRQKKFEEAFNSDDENTGVDLIADSDSDNEEHEKNRQALLSLLGNKEEVNDVQVDWNDKDEDDEDDVDDPGEEEESDENVPGPLETSIADGKEEADLKKIEPKKKQKNTYQAYLERRKQKKAERKQKILDLKEKERNALKAVEEQAKAKQKEHRHLRKAAKQKEEGGLTEAVVHDDRFKALFTDSAYAIDQSSKNYKGTKLIEKQVSLKRQARDMSQEKDTSNEDDLISKLKNKSTKWKRPKHSKTS